MYDHEFYPQQVRAILISVLPILSNRWIAIAGYRERWRYAHLTARVSAEHPFMRSSLIFSARRAHLECDGIITPVPACIEAQESLESLRRWLQKTNRELYTTGPLMPLTQHSKDAEKTLSPDAARIDDFMQQTLLSHGAQSMLLVRHFRGEIVACSLVCESRYHLVRSSGPQTLARSGHS